MVSKLPVRGALLAGVAPSSDDDTHLASGLDIAGSGNVDHRLEPPLFLSFARASRRFRPDLESYAVLDISAGNKPRVLQGYDTAMCRRFLVVCDDFPGLGGGPDLIRPEPTR